MSEEITYLAIPYEERTEAFAAAGKLENGENALGFDKDAKSWFAKPGANIEALARWLPENVSTITDGAEVEKSFAAELISAGFILDGNPVMDGKWHRVPTAADRGSAKSGSYRGFLDGTPAGIYQDFRNHPEPVKWVYDGQQTIDAERLTHVRAAAAQLKMQRDARQKATYAHHARRVNQAILLMNGASARNSYLARKQVEAVEGLKEDKRGRLIVPLHDENGVIHSLQRITGSGFKSQKKGAQKSGNFFRVGEPIQDGDPILYAEGYATAASIHMATKRTVIMAIDAGNIPTVAKKLASQYPNSNHVFLADNDFKNDQNKGLEKAQEAAALTGGVAIIPDFTDEELAAGNTDFNDLHVLHGLDAITKQLEGIEAMQPATTEKLDQEITAALQAEGMMPTPDQETLEQVQGADQAAPTAQEQATPSTPDTITLYHGSPSTFSSIDSEKIGLGQNFVGRGFYTDTTVLGVHYVMEEINHEDYHVYALDLPADATILDRFDNSSLTDDLRNRIREAGSTIHQRLVENGEPSRASLGDDMANCKEIDGAFLNYASSPQGMSILKEAGVDALKENSYIAVVNTDLVENVRLHSAVGSKAAAMKQYVEQALNDSAQDTSRLSAIMQEQPEIATHYSAIRSELETLANAQNKPEEAERLTTLLTHTLVDTVDNQPDRKATIAPLNRLYAEAVSSLGLDRSAQNQSATLGHLIDRATISIYPSQEQAADQAAPAGQEQAADQAAPAGQEQAADPAAPVGQEQAADQAAPAGQEQAADQAAPVGQEQDLVTQANERIEVVQNEEGTVIAYDRELGGSASHPDSVLGFWPANEVTHEQALLNGYDDALANDRATEKDQQRVASASQEQAATPEADGSNVVISTSPDQKPTTAVPDRVLDKYVEVEGKFYFERNPEALAFIDKGSKIQTKLSNATVAASMIDIAESRGWTEISVRGDKDFKRMAWLEAASRGLSVVGYKPREEDLAVLKKMTQERQVNEVGSTREPEKVQGQTMTAGQRNEPGAAEPVNPMAGKLVDHGAAPYKHEKGNSKSYFVTLENADGQTRTTWGKDLERVMHEADIQPGQQVELENLGRKDVTVTVPIKNEAGKVVGTEQIETYRNEFAIKAEALRDTSRPLSETAQQHPELINEIAVIKMAEKFSQNLPANQRDDFVNRVREQTAQNVNAGVAAPEVMIKERQQTKEEQHNAEEPER